MSDIIGPLQRKGLGSFTPCPNNSPEHFSVLLTQTHHLRHLGTFGPPIWYYLCGTGDKPASRSFSGLPMVRIHKWQSRDTRQGSNGHAE